MLKHQKRGFTLIELLVVIAIIGILSSVVFASLNSAREKSRDARRIADMRQIQIALELFYDSYRRYPSTADGTCSHHNSFNTNGCLQVLVSNGFLGSLPKDPLDGTYTGNWSTSNIYFYDTWCRDAGTNDQYYRVWSNAETNQNSYANNWWNNFIIGQTPCEDPS